jgi:predicted DsbA family dithiol-disulfide isomerase
VCSTDEHNLLWMWIFVKEIVCFQITPVCSGCWFIKKSLLRAVAKSQKTVEMHLNGKYSQFLKVYPRHLSPGKTSQKPFKKFGVFSIKGSHTVSGIIN